MTFGMRGWGCDEDTASRLVGRYLEAGGNVIDTADAYLASEEICGRVLRGRRDQVVLATKFGMPRGRGPNERGAGRLHIRAACEASLRRLGTDRIDLYWLHVDDSTTPVEETIAALDDLVRAGKVLYTGLSNLRAYRVMKALAISDRLAVTRPVAYQGDYNLIVRGLEREHFELFVEESLGLMSWSPLAAGMLAGTVKPGTDSPGRMALRLSPTDALHKNDRGYQVATVVQKAAAEIGCTPAQLALAWQRTRPVTSVILGVRTMTQLEENLGGLDIDLPPDVVAALNRDTAPADEYPGAFIATSERWLRREPSKGAHD
jgi:aryl-alcohol dehydrogenase-like predicted oxidoreductase